MSLPRKVLYDKIRAARTDDIHNHFDQPVNMFQAELHDGQGSPLHLCQKINLYLYAEVQHVHDFCDCRPSSDQMSGEVPVEWESSAQYCLKSTHFHREDCDRPIFVVEDLQTFQPGRPEAVAHVLLAYTQQVFRAHLVGVHQVHQQLQGRYTSRSIEGNLGKIIGEDLPTLPHVEEGIPAVRRMIGG